MEEQKDDENPAVTSSVKKSGGFWSKLDPAAPVTITSMVASFAMANMVLYGVTGNKRLAYLLSTITIPCACVLSTLDAQKDYENWKKTKHLRDKGLPEKFMPYKVKYDWSDYTPQVLIRLDAPQTDETKKSS